MKSILKKGLFSALIVVFLMSTIAAAPYTYKPPSCPPGTVWNGHACVPKPPTPAEICKEDGGIWHNKGPWSYCEMPPATCKFVEVEVAKDKHGHPKPPEYKVVCPNPKIFAFPDLPNDAEACCGPNVGSLTKVQMQPAAKELSIFGRISEPCAYTDNTLKVNGKYVNGDWVWDNQIGWALGGKISFADARHLDVIGGTEAPFSIVISVLDEATGKMVMVFKAAEQDAASGKFFMNDINHASMIFSGLLSGPFTWEAFNKGEYKRIRDAGVVVKKFSTTDKVLPLP